MKQTLLLLLTLIWINAKATSAEPAITMTTAKALGTSISIGLSANVGNTVVQVDFGDGTLIDKTIGTSPTAISGTLVGSKTVKIYGADINAINCVFQKLTAIDVAKNTALTTLNCNLNMLSSLDVTMNIALTELQCYSNQLTLLDVTKNTALKYLVCNSNQLTSLDVTMNSALTKLNCSNNMLTSLDVTMNTALTDLLCFGNQLTLLDVTKNTALKHLDCYSNKLLSLDVTKNSALKNLDCYFNQLTSLDLTMNTALTVLACNDNNFTFATLPLSKTITIILYAPQNSITILTSFATNTPIDLSSQLTADGNTTTYTWKTQTGNTLTAGIDYTISNGITTFTSAPSEKVYCEMTNATFPNLSGANALKTTLTTIITATAAEPKKASDIELYTSHQTVYLSLPEAAEVQVYDITGHQIKADYYNSGNNSFELTQKGIYVIKVNINNQVVSKKIVIK